MPEQNLPQEEQRRLAELVEHPLQKLYNDGLADVYFLGPLTATIPVGPWDMPANGTIWSGLSIVWSTAIVSALFRPLMKLTFSIGCSGGIGSSFPTEESMTVMNSGSPSGATR